MRARALFALVLLTLPALAEAQRIPMPRIRDRGPANPAPLPPTAGPIARDQQYVRLPYTTESYPFIGYFNGPTLGGRLGQFTTGGFGERLDLRLTRTLSLTLDMTASFLGGPAVTQTAELGVRVRPEIRDARKWYPFFDARGGFMHVAERNFRPYDYIDPAAGSGFYQSVGGFGGVAGTGVEYALHPRFTLTTTASVMRASLAPLASTSRDFGRGVMTAARYSVGIRYNPGRWTMPANLPQQVTQ